QSTTADSSRFAAQLDSAVQGFDAHPCAPVTFVEAQRQAGRIFVRALRLRAEAVVDTAVERFDVERRGDLAAQVHIDRAVDRLGLDARTAHQSTVEANS